MKSLKGPDPRRVGTTAANQHRPRALVQFLQRAPSKVLSLWVKQIQVQPTRPHKATQWDGSFTFYLFRHRRQWAWVFTEPHVAPAGLPSLLFIGSVTDSSIPPTSVEDLLLAKPCSRSRGSGDKAPEASALRSWWSRWAGRC